MFEGPLWLVQSANGTAQATRQTKAPQALKRTKTKTPQALTPNDQNRPTPQTPTPGGAGGHHPRGHRQGQGRGVGGRRGGARAFPAAGPGAAPHAALQGRHGEEHHPPGAPARGARAGVCAEDARLPPFVDPRDRSDWAFDRRPAHRPSNPKPLVRRAESGAAFASSAPVPTAAKPEPSEHQQAPKPPKHPQTLQVPIFQLLSKFDGTTTTDDIKAGRRRFRVTRLPRFLCVHFRRFAKNNFFVEKNPTLVTFPVKNLELRDTMPTLPAGGRLLGRDLELGAGLSGERRGRQRGSGARPLFLPVRCLPLCFIHCLCAHARWWLPPAFRGQSPHKALPFGML